jgi:hypothetical protein
MILLPIPDREVSWIFDPHGNVERLMKLVRRVSVGTSAAGVIIGNYGFGKTHIALYVSREVRWQYSRSVVVYVSTPGSSFMKVYRSFLDVVLSRGEIMEDLSNVHKEPLSTIFSEIARGGESAEYAKSWLYGEVVPQTFRTKLGLSRVNDEVALSLLLEMLRGLSRRGWGPFVFVLDELEDVALLGLVKKVLYLNLLRVFVDELPPTTLLLGLSTPAGWDDIVKSHPALARRLSTHVFYLKPFSREETRAFLNSFIERFGLGLSLDDEVVNRIYEITEGNPGEIVKLILALSVEYEGRVSAAVADSVFARFV